MSLEANYMSYLLAQPVGFATLVQTVAIIVQHVSRSLIIKSCFHHPFFVRQRGFDGQAVEGEPVVYFLNGTVRTNPFSTDFQAKGHRLRLRLRFGVLKIRHFSSADRSS
ncbi:hypothetical protein BDV10DRAFT_177666 [Aspergillus recurvatus]